MEKYYLSSLGREIQQINKTKARKLWEDGQTIYMLPSNMRVGNIWMCPMPTRKTDDRWNFNLLCADFIYYNCDNERGKYIHFYV